MANKDLDGEMMRLKPWEFKNSIQFFGNTLVDIYYSRGLLFMQRGDKKAAMLAVAVESEPKFEGFRATISLEDLIDLAALIPYQHQDEAVPEIVLLAGGGAEDLEPHEERIRYPGELDLFFYPTRLTCALALNPYLNHYSVKVNVNYIDREDL